VLIASRLDRLAFGNAGDVRPVGEGVSELRVDYGPGYRVYFQRRGNTIALLLCGGDKRTQDRDIETAKRLAREWSK
jgi:putative addiction module killer protein